MKTTGLTFKAFMEDSAYWNDNWLEEWELCIDGVRHASEESDIFLAELPATAHVEILSGSIIIESSCKVTPLKTYFQTWLQQQKTSILLVQVAKIDADTITKLIEKAGGKIL